MSIVVRTPTGNWTNVPTSWDRNRLDIGLLTSDEAIQKLGEAVCAFVSIPGHGPLTFNINNYEDYKSTVVNKIKDVITERKNELLSTFDDKTGALSRAKDDVEAAQRRLNAALDSKTGVAEAKAKRAEADAYHAAIRNFYNRVRKTLDALPWPVPTPASLAIRFKAQPICSTATGFSIAPQYVMTAAHSVAEVQDWSRYKVFFNFKAKPPPSKPVPPNTPAPSPYDKECGRDLSLPIKGHDIKRIILRDLLKNAPANLDVVTVSHNDIAILELAHDPLVAYPQTSLRLASAAPSVATHVFGIGHPHGLPLKYVAFEPGPGATEPWITAAPTVNTPRRNHSCLTADIDKHSGMSGSPLFRRDTGEVVGVGRSGVSASSRPLPATDQLHTDLTNWINKSGADLHKTHNDAQPAGSPQLPAPATRTLASVSMLNAIQFDDFRYHPDEKKFTLLQNLPLDAAIIDKNAWNRVDLYQPFTKPLREFLVAGRSIRIELNLTISSTMPLAGISPTITFDGREREVFGSLVGAYDCNMNTVPETYRYKWQRDLIAPTDLDQDQAPWNDGSQHGQLDSAAVLSAHGLCGWSELAVDFNKGFFVHPLFDEIRSINGTLTVSFAYDHGNNNNDLNAAVFTNRLDFTEGKNPKDINQKTWLCPLGEHFVTVRERRGDSVVIHEGTEGQPWTGPTWVTLPLAQRPSRQNVVADAVANLGTVFDKMSA